MDGILTRRNALACGLGMVLARSGDAAPVRRAWLLGRWQSDRERTMQAWHYQDDFPMPDAPTRERLARMFGSLRYLITAEHFTVRDTGPTADPHGLRSRYAVLGATESSITLRFSEPSLPPLTLFRESEDVLFIRSGNQRAFFARVLD